MGYDGTASPTTITCEASGLWTTVSGCNIKGNMDFRMNIMQITLKNLIARTSLRPWKVVRDMGSLSH